VFSFGVVGRPRPADGAAPTANFGVVDAHYLQTLRIPLRRGRSFDASDTATSPRVVVINETLARRYFPNEDPIGKQIDVGTPARLEPPVPGKPMPRLTIIGVIAVARTRTLSAASRVLGVRQSTVGRRLKAFEATLGARLFDTTPDGHVLNSEGKALFAHAERMEREAFSAERLLLGRQSTIAGHVRVTAPQAFGDAFVVPLLAALRMEQPHIVVALVADNAELSLPRREADIALRLGRPKQPQVVARRLAMVATGLYASREYIERRGRPRGRSLAGHDVIDYDDTFLEKRAIAWLRQRASGARCALRINGTHGVLSAVRAGLGIGALPCWLGDSVNDIARVLPTERYKQELWIAMHSDLRRVGRARAVNDFFVRELLRATKRLSGAA